METLNRRTGRSPRRPPATASCRRSGWEPCPSSGRARRPIYMYIYIYICTEREILVLIYKHLSLSLYIYIYTTTTNNNNQKKTTTTNNNNNKTSFISISMSLRKVSSTRPKPRLEAMVPMWMGSSVVFMKYLRLLHHSMIVTIYIYIYACVYIYIYICIQREREIKRERSIPYMCIHITISNIPVGRNMALEIRLLT